MDANASLHLTREDPVDPQSTGPLADVAMSDVRHLHLPGRALMQGSEEAKCTLRWMHGRVARVGFDGASGIEVGARALLYLDLVGRIEGTVSWVGIAEMDVGIRGPDAKWARLERQFEVLAAMSPADRENLRGHRRIALNDPEVALSLPDGWRTDARIGDVSRSGAAIISGVLLEIGALVTLGMTRGRVVRLFKDGFAVQFLRLLPLEQFGPAFML